MFLEPSFRSQRSGWIEVICGSMFSGKTEELIRRIKRARIANQRTMIFKPEVDTRYSEEKVISHDANALSSKPLTSAKEILIHLGDAQVVGIDEAQFFDDDLPMVCEQLALEGVRVVVAGLDMDFRGRPFGPMPQLLAIAEYITKVHAICQHCGSLATHSYRLTPDDRTVLLGEKQEYEARCRICYSRGNMLELRV
jgi:thymidine kinase